MRNGGLQTILRRAAGKLFELPRPLRRAACGRRPRNDRGAALDPQTHLLLTLESILPATPLKRARPDQLRRETRRNAWLVSPIDRRDVTAEALTLDTRPAMPARLYRPVSAPTSAAPLLLYLHGGGFVTGDLDTHDSVCQALAARAGCLVLSVVYRLAPEHVFPAAVEDALAALVHVQGNAARFGADPARIAIGGDSAGGNLATVACLRARDEGAQLPAYQVLIYPGTDMTHSMPSNETFAEGFFLTRELIDWYMSHYLSRPGEASDWRASPMFAEDLSGLPPACVVTAGFDPLRDEGDRYVERLAEAGVPVDAWCEDSLIHGFANMAGVSEGARRAVSRIGDALRRGLAPPR